MIFYFVIIGRSYNFFYRLLIFKLLNDLPKSSGGDRKSENFKIKNEVPVDFDFNEENSDVEEKIETPEIKPKSEVIKEIGFTQKQVEQLQRGVA